MGAFVEVTIKDDERGDPTISKDALQLLGLMTFDEYEKVKELTVNICNIVKELLAEKSLDLYDIKPEFGKDGQGNIMLIDEISGGNMRVYKNETYLEPMLLEKEFLM